jgi:hypothetical protein
MRSSWLVLAALSGLAVASPALAETYSTIPKASVGFIRTADRFWSGRLEPAPCARPNVRRNAFALATPRLRTATRERRGELIGEILSPPLMAQLVAAKARACAANAGETAPAPALLARGAAGLSQFQAAFSACMVREDAAQYVGSMTLWIDTACSW